MSYPASRLTTNFFATLNAEVARLKASGSNIIRLDIGSPDLPPATHIIEALNKSAKDDNNHGYQSHLGTDALRTAWADMYQRVHNVSLDPAGIIPLLGSKEGVFHVSLALLNPGDVVLVPDPSYLTYTQSAHFAGAETFSLPLLPEYGYLPDLTAIPLDVVRKAKILWLNYPNNPTGATAPKAFFAKAVEYCRKHEILLCHDAAYTQVTFGGYNAPSILEIPGAMEVAVEFNSLSKSHNMAGWRLGVAVGQAEALSALLKLKTHVDSGHFLPVLQAAVAAMTGDQTWLEIRNAIYQERRDKAVAGFREMGFNPMDPQASLYVWCPVPDGWDSDSFVLELLERANVSLAPGSIFGPSGSGYLRLSLTQPVAQIRQAMDRIQCWLK
jgi:LL-diaminopimelate aminotransferase